MPTYEIAGPNNKAIITIPMFGTAPRRYPIMIARIMITRALIIKVERIRVIMLMKASWGARIAIDQFVEISES